MPAPRGGRGLGADATSTATRSARMGDSLGSRDKVEYRNKIREAARCEPLTDQGVCSAFANRSLPLYA